MSLGSLLQVGLQVIGASFGPLGAFVGTIVGGALFGEKQHFDTGVIKDLNLPRADYGEALGIYYGTDLRPGTRVWHQTHTITNTEEVGGGGLIGDLLGGGASVTTYTYKEDVMYVIAGCRSSALLRVMEGDKCLASWRYDSDFETIVASDSTHEWEEIRFYGGSDTQLPDPDYEAAVGAGEAEAWRQFTTVFIKGLDLGQSGQVRNLRFEVTRSSPTDLPIDRDVNITTSPNSSITRVNAEYDKGSGMIWVHGSDGAVHVIDDLSKTTVTSYTLPTGSFYDMVINGNQLFVYAATSSTAYYYAFDAATATLISSGPIVGAAGYGNSVAKRIASDDAFYYLFNSYARATAPFFPLRIERVNRIDFSVDWMVELDETQGYGSEWRGVAIGGGYAVGSSHNPAETIKKLIIIRLTDGLMLHGMPFSYLFGSDQLCYNPDDGMFIAAVDLTDTYYKINPATGTYTSHTLSAAIGGDADYSVLISSVIYHPERGKLIFNCKGDVSPTQYPTLHVVNSTTYTTEKTYTYETPTVQPINVPDVLPAYNDNYVVLFGGGYVKRYYFAPATVLPNAQTLVDVVNDLCSQVTDDSSVYNASALSSIGYDVDSLSISQVQSVRSSLEILSKFWNFGVRTEGGTVYFEPLDTAPVATFAYNEIGATFSENDNSPVLQWHEKQDLELPAKMRFTYRNIDGDYQQASEDSDRIISTQSNSIQNIAIPAGMSASRARGIAETMARTATTSLITTSISALADFANLTPNDVVLVTDKNGLTHRVRINRVRDVYPLISFDVVKDDSNDIVWEIDSDNSYTQNITVTALDDTELLLLDIPILRDSDDDLGFYAVVKAANGGLWNGCVVSVSNDDLTFSNVVSIDTQGVFGVCTTTLGDYTGPRVFDTVNSVTANLGETDSALASVTEAQIIADKSANAFLIGNEVLQARDVTVISTSPLVVTLSHLLRGGRGTEWAMIGHGAGERAVKLQVNGMRRLQMSNSVLGGEKYYKATTNNKSSALVSSQAFTNLALGQKPFAPAYLSITHGTGNAFIIQFDRRSRLSTRVTGVYGVSIPLSDLDQYEIDFYADATFATIIGTLGITGATTITSTTINYELTSSKQIEILGGIQSNLYIRIYQLNETVGRGYYLGGQI